MNMSKLKNDPLIDLPETKSIINNTVSTRHYRFAQKYVELSYNATQAYLSIYGEEYQSLNRRSMSVKTAQSSSARLLSNAMVNRYVQNITNDAIALSRTRIQTVISRYTRWADSNIFDLLKIKNIETLDDLGNSYSPPRYHQHIGLKDISELPKDATGCIQSINYGHDGLKLTTVCKLRANNMLAKYLGLDKPKDKREREIIIHFDSEER